MSSHVQLTQQLNVQLPEDDIRPKLSMNEGAVCFGLIVTNIFVFLFRDLLNWCSRIAYNFDSNSSTTAVNIFQEVR